MNDFFFDKPKNRLELLMQENNYTLKKVSENTGIPVTTLSGYKKNLRTPKKENALKLADYFGVSVPYLLGLDDNTVLKNPSEDSFVKSFVKFLKDGSVASKKIDDLTPFKDDVAGLLADISETGILESYIDFLIKEKGYHPIIVKAYKQFLKEQSETIFPYLLNKSGDKNSPYHYVWEEWENSEEYKTRQSKD
ncbi:helix-turn-helix domain-containing protein [Streptococcus equinus]|uniref:helix-turn-helix domain-containing protein n=1 Tax=Streptococcus equinus TaxID=1335 RepID=UPI0015F49BD9|nr:helix-turn-helix transcriptional regulator [Streptococcus equinus]QMS95842.1 helix-turn-helix transcriptional regulator [Streptococcus equinus]